MEHLFSIEFISATVCLGAEIVHLHIFIIRYIIAHKGHKTFKQFIGEIYAGPSE